MHFSTVFTGLALMSTTGWAQYVLEDDYLGDGNFFSKFTFWNESDPTKGFVDYLEQGRAYQDKLIDTTNGQVYMGVNSENIAGSGGRGSVRITSNKSYNSGLVILDLEHMPGSICGSWPAFWMVGPSWPSHGEIDILEGVNDQSTNAMTLHTGPGCSISKGDMLGSINTSNCDVKAEGQDANAGCSVHTDNTKTYGDGFNANGGGVYATQWTSDSIKIFFFPRGSIPSDIGGGSPDPSTWGSPMALFQGGCDISSTFKDLQIVFDTTFCGDWAGEVWGSSSCSAKANTCESYVQNNPKDFKESFWTVNSLKVYQNNGYSSSAAPTATKSTYSSPQSTAVSMPASSSYTWAEPTSTGISLTSFSISTKSTPTYSSRTWSHHRPPVMRNATAGYETGNATASALPSGSGTAAAATGTVLGTGFVNASSAIPTPASSSTIAVAAPSSPAEGAASVAQLPTAASDVVASSTAAEEHSIESGDSWSFRSHDGKHWDYQPNGHKRHARHLRQHKRHGGGRL